jgi:hypothetical protein
MPNELLFAVDVAKLLIYAQQRCVLDVIALDIARMNVRRLIGQDTRRFAKNTERDGQHA